MWSILAPLIDEIGAAAIGRLFLWRHGPYRTRRACGRVVLPEFRGDLHEFYGSTWAKPEWEWIETNRKVSEDLLVSDGYFHSPVCSGFLENDRVQVRLWQGVTRLNGAVHAAQRMELGQPHWTHEGDLSVIGLGGIVQLGYHWFNRLAESLASRGVEFWMVDEPFNHRRTPRGFLPGELIAGAGPEQLVAAVRQAIIDVRVLITQLRTRGRRVGLVGQSYGGWLALILAMLEGDLDFVISLIPMCDLPAWFRAGLPLSRGARRRFPRYSKAQLDALLRPINPIAWKPALAPHRVDLHAATRDRLVLYRSIAQLARAWGSRFIAHRAGHYSLFFGSELRERVIHDVLRPAACTPPHPQLCLANR